MKKLLSLILTVMLVLSLAACSSDTGKDNTEKEESDTQTTSLPEIDAISIDMNALKKKAVEALNSLPDVDMSDSNGITIASASPMTFVTEEQSNVYSYAVTQRNQLFEKKYSTSITAFSEDTEVILESAYFDMLSGLEYADLLSVPAKDLNKFITKGILLDLKALPDSDFSADYFDYDLMEAVSSTTESYAIYGDFNKDHDNYHCLYLNNSLLETAGLASPYLEVEKGEWTWDKLLELCRAYSASGASGSALQAKNASELSNICFKSSGYDYISTSSAATPKVSFANDTTQRVLEILRGFNNGSAKLGYNTDTALAFSSGEALFCTGKTGDMKKIKALSDDWGILPLPKVDAATEVYSSYITDEHSVICVFAGADTEYVFDAIEGLNAASCGSYLTESYYRDLINTSLPNSNTLNMLDYVYGLKGSRIKNDFIDIYADRYPELNANTKDLLASAASGNTVHIFMAEENAKKVLDPILLTDHSR